MNIRKTLFFTILFLLFASLFLGWVVDRYSDRALRVVFLDAGQGDAILISRGSAQILIDTGKDGRALLSGIGRHMPPWDRTIETVLLTHPDADHIGAFPELVSRYRIGVLLSGEIPASTDPGRAANAAIERGAMVRRAPEAGMTVSLGSGVALETLFPPPGFRFDPKRTNEGSAVALLRVGADSFLFTGDLPREETVLPAVDIRVLKAAHHGSKYSTSDAFLERMRPEEAVVSVGKNSYGHPSPEVIDRFSARGIRIFRTDTDGEIVYSCPVLPEARCRIVSPAF